jgi:hypothetical protein
MDYDKKKFANSSGKKPLLSKRSSIEEVADGEVEIPDDDVPDDPWAKIEFSWRKLWLFTGPGWLMSMAYLDPGNLTSDLQQGAYTNYQLIWVLWWSTVVGWVLQTLASRLGVATGLNLAEHCREGYPQWAAVIIFLQMELVFVRFALASHIYTNVPTNSTAIEQMYNQCNRETRLSSVLISRRYLVLLLHWFVCMRVQMRQTYNRYQLLPCCNFLHHTTNPPDSTHQTTMIT